MPRSSRSILAAAIIVSSGFLGGCASGPETSSNASNAPLRAPATVMVLPSARQEALAASTGIPSSPSTGWGNAVLGGRMVASRGPSTGRVDVRSDQRLINGRVYENLRWRSRSTVTTGR